MPFPVHALAPWQRDMVLAVSRHAQTDPDMAAMFCLGFSSFVVARNCVLVDEGGRRDPLALWVIVIAESGAGKSATFNPLIAPILQLGQAAAGQGQLLNEPDVSAPARGRDYWQRIRDEADGALEAETVPAPGAPWATLEEVGSRLRVAQEAAFPGVLVRLVEADITPEALVERMSTQLLGILQASSEAELLTRVSAGGTAAVQALGQLNKMWVAENIEVARIGRGQLTARWPVLTIVVSPQPAAFQEIRSGRLGNLIDNTGFLARCLFAVPESTVGRRRPGAEPIPDDVRVRYAQNLRAMLAATLPTSGERTVLRMSDAAAAVAHRYYDEVEPQLGAGGELHDVRLWASRVRQSAQRTAAMLHVADLAHNRQHGMSGELVSVDAMERAVQIARWQMEHGRQVWCDGQSVASPSESNIVDWVRRLGSPTERELYRAMGFSGPEPIRPGLNQLLANRVLVQRVDGRTRRYSLADG